MSATGDKIPGKKHQDADVPQINNDNKVPKTDGKII